MGKAYFASTDAIDPADRIEYWNSGSSMIGGVKAEAMSDLFDAEVAFRRLEDLTVGSVTTSPHRVSLFPSQRRASLLRLRYQQSGTSILFEGHRSFTLRPGEWMLVDPHAPQTSVNKGDVSSIWLDVPCASLPQAQVAAVLAGNPRLAVGDKLGADLVELTRYLVGEAGDLSVEAERDVSCRLTKLFRQALGQASQSPAQLTSREDIARRARDYVDRHLQDPDLSVESIARELGCTPRYVHKAFEGSESICRYIWNRRLDMCRDRLEMLPMASKTLTALAFDYGFNSSSHFSRSFRERFGTSPSAFLASVQRASN